MELHPGVEDSILYNLGTELLCNPLKSDVQTIFNQLKRINNEELRIIELNELGKVLNNHKIKNINELIWFYQCTACYLLLKKLPYCLNQGMIQLMRKTFEVSNKEYITKNNVDILAKNLFHIVINDFNLVYLVRQMSSYSNLAMYVGLSLLWAGIIRLCKISFTIFKIYKINKLNVILKNYNMEYIKKNLDTFVIFLRIEEQINYLQIQKRYFVYKHEKNCDFDTYFHTNISDILFLKEWFEALLQQLDSTITKGIHKYSIDKNVLDVYDILDSEINLLSKHLYNNKSITY